VFVIKFVCSDLLSEITHSSTNIILDSIVSWRLVWIPCALYFGTNKVLRKASFCALKSLGSATYLPIQHHNFSTGYCWSCWRHSYPLIQFNATFSFCLFLLFLYIIYDRRLATNSEVCHLSSLIFLIKKKGDTITCSIKLEIILMI